jgi:hypothetical protein
MLVFVFGFCSAVYFLKCLIESVQSPEFKYDAERLRENRRLRRAARRRR